MALDFVALGANLAHPRATLDAAQRRLRALPGVRGFRASHLYRTSPVDAGGPDFLNAVVCFDCPQEPAELLARLHAIEADFGRARPYRNAPRTLDLDLILAAAVVEGPAAPDGGRCIDDARVVVPHPRAHARAFVLAPLLELWPAAVIPGRGPAAALLAAALARGDQRIERLPPVGGRPSPTRRPSAR